MSSRRGMDTPFCRMTSLAWLSGLVCGFARCILAHVFDLGDVSCIDRAIVHQKASQQWQAAVVRLAQDIDGLVVQTGADEVLGFHAGNVGVRIVPVSSLEFMDRHVEVTL